MGLRISLRIPTHEQHQMGLRISLRIPTHEQHQMGLRISLRIYTRHQHEMGLRTSTRPAPNGAVNHYKDFARKSNEFEGAGSLSKQKNPPDATFAQASHRILACASRIQILHSHYNITLHIQTVPVVFEISK